MADGYQRPIFKYTNVTGTGATTVKSTVGILRGIVIGTPAAGTITVADAGGNISIITATTTGPFYIEFDCAFTTLTTTASVAMNYTVIYQ